MSDAEIEQLLAGLENYPDNYPQSAVKTAPLIRELRERAKQAEARLAVSFPLDVISLAVGKLAREHCRKFPEFWDFLLEASKRNDEA